MNTSLVKYKDLALKVIYYTKRRQLGSKIFFAKSKFQEVLLYFERNLKDPQTFLKSSYFLNGKQIFPNDILLYFCTVDPNLRLVEEDLYIEIEELEHIDDSSEPIYEKLLKPLINPFKLIILNVKEGILQMVDFPKDKIKEFGLDCLDNNNFACCNSIDALFISYGKNFWIISNKNFAIEKKEMPVSKEKHSMNYILSNNTVFIAGGNNEDSFYYDINTKEFITWGKMNGVQEKPALIQFGDFLYSFNSFNPSGIYFEKTKLTSPAKKWEKLIPQSGDQESGFFYNKLYGVSKCTGGNILFAGGINNQLRTFVYNLKLNVLYININKDEPILLTERTFYKIDHNFNIAITQNLEKDHIIAIVNKNSKSLNLIPFEQIGTKTRNQLLQHDNPRNRLPGNLVIQCRYMSIKDYENFLKQREEGKHKFGDNKDKKDQKKLGDKIEPFKFNQYRNKTPLALERISEGKSEEENDEDEFSRNRSSSAKKEKSKLELDSKEENIGKFNLATQKLDGSDKKEKKENENNLDKKVKSSNIDNNKDDNNEEKEKNCHSDLEHDEIDNKKNPFIEANQEINNEANNEKKQEISSKDKKGLVKNEKISRSHKLIKSIKGEKFKTYNNENNENISLKNSSHKDTNNSATDQKKIVILHKTNSNENSNANSPNTNQKSIPIPPSQNKRSNITIINSTSSQKNQQDDDNPFIDNSKYQNLAAKESYHLKSQNEPIANKINSSNTKTMTTVQQKRSNLTKPQSPNTTENHVLTEPNSNTSIKTISYKSNTNTTSTSNTQRQVKGKTEEQKSIKKTNSFKVKINLNQEQKKNPQPQRAKLNINLNINNQNNNNNTSNTALTEGNKSSYVLNKSQNNNTNVISTASNTGIKITKVTSSQNQTNNNTNNEMNKEGKRYVLTRNVQRVRRDDDAQKKLMKEMKEENKI